MSSKTEQGILRTLDVQTACEIGLAESIILHQIQYWIKIKSGDKKKYKDSFRDGKCWVYNSYRAWKEQLPFYSEHTIRRAINHLVDLGVLIKGNYNKLAYDNTNWYTIDDETLKSLTEEKAPVQNGQTVCPNWTDDMAKMDKPIPETTHDITTKTTSESNRAGNCKTVSDTQEAEFNFNVLSRQIRKVCKDTDREVYTDGIIDVFRWFYNMYEYKLHKKHKRLKDSNIESVIERMKEYYISPDKDDMMQCYKSYIWDYFNGNNHFTGNESGECDYSIVHFISTLDYRVYNTEREY